MHWIKPLTVLVLLGASACTPTGTTPTSGTPTRPATTSGGSPPPPCHPGCFPAGTLVATPDGPRPIEQIEQGERVTLIRADGIATSGPVEGVFQTCNLLLEVRTEAGTLLTTRTQPLCLVSGGFRPAGELTEGDTIWRWEGGQRQAERIRAVVPKESEAKVFNLVVGESAVFVAGGYLARGKPPLPTPVP